MEEYIEESPKNAFPQIKPIELRCIGKNVAVQLCGSQHCQQSAYLCGSDKCPCHQQVHEFCSSFKIDSILKKMVQKQLRISNKVNQFVKRGQQIYDQMLQMVSQQRQKFLNRFQHIEHSMEIESNKLLNILEGKSKENINGALVGKVMRQLKDKQQLAYSEYDWKQVEQLWTTQREMVLKKVESITQQLLSLVSKSTIQSTIVISVEELRSLQSFLPKPVKSMKNIYRASQQKFSTDKFIKQCCSIKNTMTLALTTAGKKIGGFTPLTWKRTGKHKADKNGETFIFSLTDKQKYADYSKDPTVYHSQGRSGPGFGSSDFKIVQGADKNDSFFSLGANYGSQNSIQSKQQIWTRFSGAIDGCKITLKQWQVFEVIFE